MVTVAMVTVAMVTVAILVVGVTVCDEFLSVTDVANLTSWQWRFP